MTRRLTIGAVLGILLAVALGWLAGDAGAQSNTPRFEAIHLQQFSYGRILVVRDSAEVIRSVTAGSDMNIGCFYLIESTHRPDGSLSASTSVAVYPTPSGRCW